MRPKYWLELLRDANLISDGDVISNLLKELSEISNMIASAVMKLKKKNI